METKEYRLTDICDFQGGTQPPKEEWINEPREGYVRMLQIRDFTQDKAEHVGYVKDTKKLNKCKEDDILIGRYGASVGKILTGLSGAYNVAIIKTIPNDELISKRYLFYVLKGTAFQNFISTIGARAAQAGFNKNDLSFFKLHLPIKLKDQDLIVNILDNTAKIIKQREKGVELLDKLLNMKFLELFGDPSLNKKNWKIEPLKNSILSIRYGTSTPPEYKNEGIPFLRATNIKKGKIIKEGMVFISEEEAKKIKKCKVKAGDLLIVRSGANTGDAAVVSEEYDGAYAAYDLIIEMEKYNSIFFNHIINSPFGKKVIKPLTQRAGQPHINSEQIQALSFYNPDIKDKIEFQNFKAKIDLIKELYHKEKESLIELFNSLNQKALQGKLDIIERTSMEISIKTKPEISPEIIAIYKVNKELQEFHNSQAHTGAPDEIDNKIRQVEAELKIRGEIPFWDEYVKYKIVKRKFKDAFTFEQLWEEIAKFPFETMPEYDEVSSMIFKWLEEVQPFLKQEFNKEKNQIELIVNETAEA